MVTEEELFLTVLLIKNGIRNRKKFLVDVEKLNPFLQRKSNVVIQQGFLSTNKDKIVRIRTYNDLEGYITIKGSGFVSHKEFEYQIPISDAMQLLGMCGKYISKRRYQIYHENHMWEVDFFLGENEGLVLAEIELHTIDEEFEKPEWVLKEVTGDKRYYNNNLIENPFKNWK